ncbi:hypothetical protein Gpo141_00007742 [Globisporangium polare]
MEQLQPELQATQRSPSTELLVVNTPAGTGTRETPNYYFYDPHSGVSMSMAQEGNQQIVNHRDQIETGCWTTSLRSICHDCVPNLLMAWCCPCISLAQVHVRLGLYEQYDFAPRYCHLTYLVGFLESLLFTSRTNYSHDYNEDGVSHEDTALAVVVPLVVFAVGQSLFRSSIWQARSNARTCFEIPGNCCSDCLIACCCAIAQLAAHTKCYTPGSCSFDAPSVLPPPFP